MNAKERKRTIAASKSWREFGNKLGWRLYGFSDEFSASFLTGDRNTLTVTIGQREDIERAIAGQPYPPERNHDLGWCDCVHADDVMAWGSRSFSSRPWCGMNCGETTRRKRDVTCLKCRDNMAVMNQMKAAAKKKTAR